MSSKTARTVIVSGLLAGFIFLAVILLTGYLVQRPDVQHYLFKHLSRVIGQKIDVRRINFSFANGALRIQALNLVIRSDSGDGYVSVPETGAIFAFRQMIKGNFVPLKIYISHPTVKITGKRWLEYLKQPHPNTTSSVTDLKSLMALNDFSIRDGDIFIKDMSIRLKNINANIHREQLRPLKITSLINGVVWYKDESSPLKIIGVVSGKESARPSVEIKIKAAKFPLNWLPPTESFCMHSGYGDIDLKIRDAAKIPINAQGTIKLQNPVFTISDDDDIKDYAFPYLSVNLKASYSNKTLSFSPIKLTGPKLHITSELSFDINNLSNPHLSLKVHTPFMPLAVLKNIFPASVVCPWVKNNVVPLLVNGKGSVVNFSLNGTIGQIKNLDVLGNDHVLSMLLSFQGVEALKNAGGIPVRNISANVSIKNGNLFISDVKGQFGSSSLNKGYMSLTNIYTHKKMDYLISIDGIFDLADIKTQTKISFIPEDVKRVVARFKRPSGRCKTHCRIVYNTAWKSPAIDNAIFDFKNCLFEHDQLFLPVYLKRAHVQIKSNASSSFNATGRWGKSGFHLSGTSANSWNNISSSITGQINLPEIAGLFHVKSPFAFNQIVLCQGLVMKKGNYWSVKGQMGVGGISVQGDPVALCPLGKDDVVTFNLDITPDSKISLHSIWHIKNSRLKFNCIYDNGRKRNLRLHLYANKFSLGDILLKGLKKPLAGMVSCNIDTRICMEDPSASYVNGSLQAQGISFCPASLPFCVNNCSLHVKGMGKQFKIEKIEGKIGKSNLQIQGFLRGWDGLKGSLSVMAGYLDIDDMIDVYKTMAPDMIQSETADFIKKSDVNISVDVNKGKWDQLYYGPLKADCRFSPSGFLLKAMTARLEHGRLQIKGHIKDKEDQFSASITLNDQPADKLLHTLTGQTSPVKGIIINLQADLSSTAGDIKSLGSGLDGTMNVLIKKGTIYRSSPILKILNFLSLKKIINLNYSDVFQKGFSFDSIMVNLVARKGIVKVNKLMMYSDSFNMAGTGTIDLGSNTLNLDLGVQPLGSIDFLVRNIPLIGYIITGKQRSVLVYYFKATGPLDDPNIQYVPLKNIGSNTLNFFKRLFLTPKRIFEQLFSATEYIIGKTFPTDTSQYYP